jgi:Ca2+-binding EF-hand superfamily protein
MFDAIDLNKDGSVTKEEATTFWGKNFAKINAQAMFNEVDVNKDGSVTKEEWMGFWKNVLKHGYPEEDLLEEVDMLKEGGSWVDYNDGRTT